MLKIVRNISDIHLSGRWKIVAFFIDEKLHKHRKLVLDDNWRKQNY